MHELSIASAIVDTVLRHARGRAVTGVHLRVGALRQVVPDSLDFYFGIVTRDTLCADATLELELVSALLRCAECGHEWDPAPAPAYEGDPLALLPRFRCPDCRAAGAQVLQGNELEVESIEVVSPSPEPATSGDAPHKTIIHEEG
jgi:hydrogenase nickel incorporation protein HypA/HybF